MIRLILLSLLIFSPLTAIESFIELKINNEIITNIDLDNEARYLFALNNELEGTDKKTLTRLAKESIIKEKIKKNELLKYYRLDNTEVLLDEIIKEYYKKLNIKNLKDFETYLKKYNLEMKIFKQKIEIELLWNRLIGLKYQNQINVNEEKLKKQVDEFYNNNELVTEYELSEIVFQIENDNDLNNKINLIQKDINDQGFKNAANIHSIADSSKFGGEIGWINEKQLSKEISLAIQELKVNEVSKPIRVANGFLILKIENRKQNKIETNKVKLLEQTIAYEKNKQYRQFSIIYFNKIKLNSTISE
tara:strand:+ start:1297 stop:2211 length:915 start_codon:yes stop_codon:yes gene_type:complete